MITPNFQLLQSLAKPIYFPSISSVKTNLLPVEYVRVLNSMSTVNTHYLISAYDLISSLSQDELLKEIENSKSKGVIVLMDSGNYEAYWKNVKSSWSRNHFHQAISLCKPNFAFSFDDQAPPPKTDDHVKKLISDYQADTSVGKETLIIPIIHGTPENLPTTCQRFLKEVKVPMIAVAERELGGGLVERVNTLRKIRTEVDNVLKNTAIHLLGTGNPLSLLAYSAAGANSFDGLEWCQTAANHESALLYHFSHADLLLPQSNWNKPGLPFQLKTLAHNLTFYTNWMKEVRDSVKNGSSLELGKRRFSENIYNPLWAALS